MTGGGVIPANEDDSLLGHLDHAGFVAAVFGSRQFCSQTTPSFGPPDLDPNALRLFRFGHDGQHSPRHPFHASLEIEARRLLDLRRGLGQDNGCRGAAILHQVQPLGGAVGANPERQKQARNHGQLGERVLVHDPFRLSV